MLSLYDRETMSAALEQPLTPKLRGLLERRINQCERDQLIELTHFLVIQPGDTEEDIQQEVGFSPLVNPVDRGRYPSRFFQPFWDWLQAYDGWFELILTVGNSGFAYVLLIENAEGVASDLLSLCRAYVE